MLLVSQRISRAPGLSEIESYHYAHPDADNWVWEVPEGIPDQNPGKLVTRSGHKTSGRIQSYLDIAAPDGTSPESLYWSHEAIISLMGIGARFPLSIISGPMFVRFEIEPQMSDDWHPEFHTLFNSAVALL